MSSWCRHLVVHGRVQGVGYRWSMVQQARPLGLRGWVRNRLDGTVEALVEGAPAAVQALVDWAHRGPEGARVTRVEQADAAPPDDLPAGFEQRPTA